MLDAYNPLVKPILLFSTEIWGHDSTEDSGEIEKSFSRFCKHILGVHRNTTNLAIYGELGVYPLTFGYQNKDDFISTLSSPSDGQALSDNTSGEGGCPPPPPPLEILTIACLTFYLLLTDRLILRLPEYKLEVVNICKMDGTGGLEVVAL